MRIRNIAARVLLVLAVAAGLWWWQERGSSRSARRPDTSPAVVEVRREVRVDPVAGTSRYRVRMARIPSFAGQRVLSETWNIPPTDSGSDSSGDWFGWDVANPDSTRTFSSSTRVEVLNAGLSALPRSTAAIPDPDLFLGSDSFRHPDDPSVRAFAEPLRGPDTLSSLRAVWDAVLGRLSYGGYDPDDRGSREALSKGSGDCGEFADLFAAASRVLGIPARRVNGWSVGGRGTSKHAWVEAWIPSRGWTAFDPLWGKDGSTSFEHVPTPRVAVSWSVPGPGTEFQPFTAWRWWGTPAEFSARDTILPVPAAAPADRPD